MSQSGTQARGDRPDLLAGVVLVGLGALGLWAGRGLTFGTPAAMGSGFLPRALSLGLIALGAIVFASGLRRARVELDGVNLRPLLFLVLAIGGFAFGAKTFGFVLSSAWLIVIGSLADAEFRWKEIALSTLILTASGVVIFVSGLGVQMPIWPWL